MACSCPRIFGHDWMGTRPHIVEPTFIAGFGRLVIGLEHWMEVKSCSAKYCSLISQECPNEAFIPWRAGPCANSYDFTPSGITRMSRRQICNARFGVWIYLRHRNATCETCSQRISGLKNVMGGSQYRTSGFGDQLWNALNVGWATANSKEKQLACT